MAIIAMSTTAMVLEIAFLDGKNFKFHPSCDFYIFLAVI
jgi:hypothetical protein